MQLMKDLTPKKISLIIAAFALAGFLIVIGGLSFFHLNHNSSYIIAVITGAVFIFSAVYLATLTIIERFVYKKIKIIYRTIHNLKLGKTNFPDYLDVDSDIISQVNRDVINWANSKRQEIENLKNREEYRKEFIGNVSHELKTPIFNIQGYILTLLEGGLEDEKINRDYLFRAEKSVDRMISIVEDLDTVTRLESGQLTMDLVKFDIVELAKDVAESNERNASIKKIQIIIKKKNDRPVMVYGDKDRIRQVLTNLMVNSIKYGKQEGRTEIRFYDMEENILVEVSDNGIGIAEEHLPRLFERFYRVDKSRSRDSGGSGLGLAIVKHIIEAHEQTINVRSSEGEGSTFSFTLEKAR
jgi:two-component system, OmpR family, phosphate regulon sensor histidine kinase PhoR